jgi:DNA mismatch endonuclease (patch repair protein)
MIWGLSKSCRLVERSIGKEAWGVLLSNDVFTPEKRSEVMSLIRGKDTKPELAVRSILHRMGYRFRLHRKNLPGKPDIVLPRYRTVVFVHGCFWHQHDGCPDGHPPKSRKEFWLKKLDGNKARDKRNLAALSEAGWRVIVIWECELKPKLLGSLKNKLRQEIGFDT